MTANYSLEEDQQVQLGLVSIRNSKAPALLKQNVAKAVECYLTGKSLTPVLNKSQEVRDAVRKDMTKKYEMMAIKDLPDVYYVRDRKKEKSFRPIDGATLRNMTTDLYEKKSGTIDGPHIDKILNTLDKTIRRDMEVPRIDNTIIEIAPNYYWNGENGNITDDVPEGYYCARRLFDTPKGSKNVVKYNSKDIEHYVKMVKKIVEQTTQTMEENEGDLFEDSQLDFITTWACGNHEVYMDILRMMASNFMTPKPFGAYILRGQGRNGKSVCVGLLHTIFGTNNTTRIQMSDITNWHKYLQLANTMLNAPDEEEDKALTDQSLFKTIADHGEIQLDIMRGQKPLTVEANFQIISPANHDPEWTGTGAEACIRRARIIPFEADLSDRDSDVGNFAQDTFTPSRIMYLLGVILGVARYYLSHPFPDSKTMKKERKMLVETMASYKIYYERLNKYFGTYNKLREVYVDYKNWCIENGMTIKPYDEFKVVFKSSQRRPTSYHDAKNSLSRVYRMNSYNTCFHSNFVIPEHEAFGNIQELNDRGNSIVTALDNMYGEDENDKSD